MLIFFGLTIKEQKIKMEAWSLYSSKQVLLQSADFTTTNTEYWLLVKDRTFRSLKSLHLLTLTLEYSKMHRCRKDQAETALYCIFRLAQLRNTVPNKLRTIINTAQDYSSQKPHSLPVSTSSQNKWKSRNLPPREPEHTYNAGKW